MKRSTLSLQPQRSWHPELSGDESLYRTSPYEFAETYDSGTQIIRVEATVNVGHIVVVRSPFSEVCPSSNLLGEDTLISH